MSGDGSRVRCPNCRAFLTPWRDSLGYAYTFYCNRCQRRFDHREVHVKRVIEVQENEWLGGLVVGTFYKTDSGRIVKIVAVDRARSRITVED